MLIGLPHVWNTFLALSVAYTATDPGWNCAAAHVSLSSRDSGAIDLIPIYGGANVTAVGEFTDPEAKCVYYERGECVPQYSKEYTSIVTEVLYCDEATHASKAFLPCSLLPLF